MMPALARAVAGPEDARPNFVIVLAEAQGWANTSVRMDDRLPDSRSGNFRTPAVERLAREGDTVSISPCRPMSRRKSWRLVSVVERGSAV